MEIHHENGFYHFRIISPSGEPILMNIDYLSKVNNWESLASQMIFYCCGNEQSSIKSWVSRVNSIFRPTIEESQIKSIPNSVKKWTVFIKNLYVMTLITDSIKSSLKTRVSIWNKNIRPFLSYLQDKDYIPGGIIVPSMKKVGEGNNNSSFNVKMIGDKSAYKVEMQDSLNRLLTPISLYRTDAEYLDEVFYDLERKRNKLYECLVNYWKNIKTHYETGSSLLSSANVSEVERRIRQGKLYNCHAREGRVPPIRRHFLAEANSESVSGLLYLYKSRLGYVLLSNKRSFKGHPSNTAIYNNGNYIKSILPSGYLEDDSKLKFVDRLNWSLGVLGNRDVSYIVALLIMENPKFNFEALLDCKWADKNGKLALSLNNNVYSFFVDKKRAKAQKKETLSKLSVEIIKTLISMQEGYKDYIDKKLMGRLFVIRAQNTAGKVFRAPQKSRVSCFLTGLDTHIDQAYESYCLNTFFPSLDEAGLPKGTINHKKLRDTEAVLEYFRTGSVRAVSNKLGNSNRVALKHYIPQVLISAFNTRQIRKFQNLLIVAATKKEDYLLDAVDFNNLNELNAFISNMLTLDNKGINPLLNIICDQVGNISNNDGELIANISEDSLCLLYAYTKIAEKSNVEAAVLSKKDVGNDISPLALITLSKYLHSALISHPDRRIRDAHKAATKSALKLIGYVSWESLFINKSIMS